MNMVKQFLIQVYFSFIYYIPHFLRELLLYVGKRRTIILNSFLNYKFGIFHHCNWGDDINKLFIADGIGSDVILYQNSILSKLKHKENYMCIGSMLHDCNSQTIVWGSGFLSDDDKFRLKEKPKKVLAVRGKLSRQFLLEQGVECPEVYGDPALLLPLFYKKQNIKKQYKLGIVAHIYDEGNPFVQGLKGNNDVIIISLQSYDNWLHVIDKICECELILSSSLHGIIVSDAYGIPNAWVEFSDKVVGNGFKFRDYFSSVSKNVSEPIRITTPIDINNLDKYKETWESPTCDLSELVKACPFPSLKEQIKDITVPISK